MFACASCKLVSKVTLLDMKLYPARGSFEDRLGLVYEDLKNFAKSEKLTLHMSSLTRTLVRFPENDSYPSGNLGAWLEHGQQFSSCRFLCLMCCHA